MHYYVIFFFALDTIQLKMKATKKLRDFRSFKIRNHLRNWRNSNEILSDDVDNSEWANGRVKEKELYSKNVMCNINRILFPHRKY